MRNLTKTLSLTVTTLLALGAAQVFAQAGNLSDLLELVRQDAVSESADYSRRVQEFEQNANRQQEILDITEQRYIEQENLQGELSTTFENNTITIGQKREILRDARGDLNELFGTLQGVAGDFLSTFENSLISAQYPGRSEAIEAFIEKAGSTIEQLDVSEIETFWFYMQQEMTESARVVTYSGDVTLPAGDTVNRQITRIGSFNAVSGGDYLSYDGDIGHLQVLPKQPPAGIIGAAMSLEASTSGFTRVGIDPTGGVGGQVMANLVNFSVKVRSQLKSDKPSKNNPLGRVLMVAESNPDSDTETLELKLGEAILQETPALESMLTLIKMIATIAPLGGLLGTVTGMIVVFQQITVYGAGDPTIMAGGISSALMTTVLGIVVAIPTIFMHTVVKSRADTIMHILEEQATGMIAQKAERMAGNRS